MSYAPLPMEAVVLTAALSSLPAHLRKTDGTSSSDAIRLLFEKVERAKQEWEATADALPELICLVDQFGGVLRANRAVEVWGLGRVASVFGTDLHVLLHGVCRAFDCALNRFLSEALQGAMHGLAANLTVYDSSLLRHVQITVRPMAAHRGTYAAVVIVEDVTECRQAEEAERRRVEHREVVFAIEQAILAVEQPEDAVCATLQRVSAVVAFDYARVMLSDAKSVQFQVLGADADGHVVFQPTSVLPEAVCWAHCERRPDRCYQVDDLRHLADPTEPEQELRAGGLAAYVNTPLLADGEFVGSLIVASRLPGVFDADQVGFVREVAGLLAIAIQKAQLALQLRTANGELETALHARDDIVRYVSHELRSPLHLMRGYTELLLEGSLGGLSVEQKAALVAMLGQADRLQRMAEQLLISQGGESRLLNRAPLDVAAFLAALVENWRLPCARQGCKFCLELSPDLPPVPADAEQLTHIISNLLDNAVKFSPQGGTITVGARIEGGDCIISISDQGLGIPTDKLEAIFERFYQVHHKGHSQGGIGLGLALCRDMVAAHGGRIWAGSAGPGSGATFHVALPIDATLPEAKIT